jgi:PII-like signaling protein
VTRIEGSALLARIYIGEADHHDGHPLYQVIVAFLRERGIAGATVFRGIEGYGANAHLHTTRLLRLSEDLPILIEVVDREDRLRAVLPDLDAMVVDGLITLERVEVVAYRATSLQHDVNEPPTHG